MFRTVPVTIVCLLLLTKVGYAETPSEKFKSMPWHLIDLWWEMGEDRPFEHFSMDVSISKDVPESICLYIAPIGLGDLNKTKFYGGIQSIADGYTRADSRLRKIGPGFLMSMWGERDLSAIRTSEGGFFQSSGHEGDFVSIRRPFRWTKGEFTYHIVKMDQEVVNEKTVTWVGAFVELKATGEQVYIGALRFPEKDLKLSRSMASFVEIYGPAIPVEKIPKLTVVFGNLRINGDPVPVSGCYAIYPEGVPDYADARADGLNVVIDVGQAVTERPQRKVKLIPAK